MESDALIIVDAQSDFFPGGRLALPRSETIVPILNSYVEKATKASIPVFATRGCYLPHASLFESLPSHCIQGTKGSELYSGLKFRDTVHTLTKVMDANIDGYSALDIHLDTNQAASNGPSLAQALRQLGVTRIFVAGVGTEFNVARTVKNALSEMFNVVWLCDASVPAEMTEGDGKQAELEMLKAGATAITIEQFQPVKIVQPPALTREAFTKPRYRSVFLSHSHIDNKRCMNIARKLIAKGIDVWIDLMFVHVAENLTSQIADQLEQRTALVLIVSEASNDSLWVLQERSAYNALVNDKETRIVSGVQRLLIPVRLSGRVPVVLRGFFWLDALHRSDDQVADDIAAALAITAD